MTNEYTCDTRTKKKEKEKEVWSMKENLPTNIKTCQQQFKGQLHNMQAKHGQKDKDLCKPPPSSTPSLFCFSSFYKHARTCTHTHNKGIKSTNKKSVKTKQKI
jgi:hypothetical protein